LYKRRTILGTNNAVLATPRVGAKEVMADYIEDLQITNISTTGTLYTGTNGLQVFNIWNPTKAKKQRKVGTIPSTGSIDAMAFGSNGLLYTGTHGLQTMSIWDITKPKNQKKVGTIPNTGYIDAMAFGPTGLLYTASHGGTTIKIWDITKPKNQKLVDTIINTGSIDALAFDIKKTGSTSVVSVNLTIRTKEKYGKNRLVDKKDYHSGNFNFSKNDQYQRDTFSTTVSVRNL